MTLSMTHEKSITIDNPQWTYAYWKNGYMDYSTVYTLNYCLSMLLLVVGFLKNLI